MSTDLVVMDAQIAEMIESGEYDYETVAKLTGQVSTAVAEHRSTFKTAGFQADDIYTYDKEEHEVPAKSIRIVGGEQKAVFLDKELEMIILTRRYMFRRWDNLDKKYAATSEISTEYKNQELRDDSGGVNAGRFSRYVPEEELSGMDPDLVELHKSAKLYRVVYALVRGKGFDIEGNPVEVDWTPVRFSFGSSVREDIDGIVNTFNDNKTLTFQNIVSLKLAKGKAGPIVIARPTFDVQKFKKTAPMDIVGPYLKEMMADIKGHNEYIKSKFDAFNSAKAKENVASANPVESEFEDVGGVGDLDDEIPF